jgi:hypothetical protein
MTEPEPSDGVSEDEAAAIAAVLTESADSDVGELTDESIEAEDVEPRATGIISHVLRCRQGLDHQYVYDLSTFKPPSTGEMWTRVAFYDASGRRLLLTAWRYKGSANPYATYGNQWTWRSTAVARSLDIWWMSTGYQWSRWANCS